VDIPKRRKKDHSWRREEEKTTILENKPAISLLHHHQLFASISTKSLDNYELKEDMIKAKENDFYIYRRSKD
jgi:hypothetical protein